MGWPLRSLTVIAGLDQAIHRLAKRYYGANATRNLIGHRHLSGGEAEWAERASNFLKAKLKETGVTYIDLAKPLCRNASLGYQ
jgi:hypothetical protein